MVNCTLAGVSSYNSIHGGVYNPTSKHETGIVINVGYMNNNDTKYWDWWFGYDSYMPINVIVDNFKSGTLNTYLFPSFVDAVFTTATYPLHKTESVTFRNMNPIPICADSAASEMNKIPYKVETTKKED